MMTEPKQPAFTAPMQQLCRCNSHLVARSHLVWGFTKLLIFCSTDRAV